MVSRSIFDANPFPSGGFRPVQCALPTGRSTSRTISDQNLSTRTAMRKYLATGTEIAFSNQVYGSLVSLANVLLACAGTTDSNALPLANPSLLVDKIDHFANQSIVELLKCNLFAKSFVHAPHLQNLSSMRHKGLRLLASTKAKSHAGTLNGYARKSLTAEDGGLGARMRWLDGRGQTLEGERMAGVSITELVVLGLVAVVLWCSSSIITKCKDDLPDYERSPAEQAGRCVVRDHSRFCSLQPGI